MREIKRAMLMTMIFSIANECLRGPLTNSTSTERIMIVIIIKTKKNK